MLTTREIIQTAKEMMMEYGAVVNERVLLNYCNVLLSTVYDKLTTNSDIYYSYIPATLNAYDDTLGIPVPSFNNRVDRILLASTGQTIKKVNSYSLPRDLLGTPIGLLPTAWCQMPSMRITNVRMTPASQDVELTVVMIPERPKLGLPCGRVDLVRPIYNDEGELVKVELELTTPVGNSYFNNDAMETQEWVSVTSLEGKCLGTFMLEGRPQGDNGDASIAEPETLTLVPENREMPRYAHERVSPISDALDIQVGDYITRGGLVAGTYLGDTVDNFLILGLVATLKDSLLEGTKIIGSQADSYFRDLSAQSRGRDNASHVVRSYRYTDMRGIR